MAHRLVQHEVEEQLDARQIEAEPDPFDDDDVSHAVLHHRQAYRRAIGGDPALKGMQAGAVATGLPHMILMLVSIVRCVKSLIRDIRA